MGEKVKGNLLIIGGAEDKQEDCIILRRFVDYAGGRDGQVVIMTSATEMPEKVGREYQKIFKGLGMPNTTVVDIPTREEANREKHIETIRAATGIFFTGGDQLRITSLLGGSLVETALQEAYHKGVVIAGTSAGASAMSNTMIIQGDNDNAPQKNTVTMAPGMGFLEEVVIDQHFAQRGRIGRLLTAVAQNPNILGIGIDEDTAIAVSPEATFEVIGAYTVTVLDGRNIKHTNVSESDPNQALALTDVILHILPAGYQFDLKSREPIIKPAN